MFFIFDNKNMFLEWIIISIFLENYLTSSVLQQVVFSFDSKYSDPTEIRIRK